MRSGTIRFSFIFQVKSSRKLNGIYWLIDLGHGGRTPDLDGDEEDGKFLAPYPRIFIHD